MMVHANIRIELQPNLSHHIIKSTKDLKTLTIAFLDQEKSIVQNVFF